MAEKCNVLQSFVLRKRQNMIVNCNLGNTAVQIHQQNISASPQGSYLTFKSGQAEKKTSNLQD